MGEGFLGIDESNHGRTPEIYVAVFSTDKKDIEESKEILPKIRRNLAPDEIEEIIGGREFKYILVPETARRNIGDHGIQAVVLAEFFMNFNSVHCIYIDGYVQTQVLERLKENISPLKMPHVSAVLQGDTKVPLINIADCIANYLHRRLVNARGLEGRLYSEKIIIPEFEHYARIIRLPEKEKG